MTRTILFASSRDGKDAAMSENDNKPKNKNQKTAHTPKPSDEDLQ